MKNVINQDYINELSHHFFHDTSLLKAQGFIQSLQSDIKKIKRMGDVHESGRSVVLLTVDKKNSRGPIIYKPRCVKIEKAFNQFIQWVNTKTDLNLKSPACIPRKNYGWAEYIAYKPCQTKKDVKIFYTKLGALLGISTFLVGTDIHHDNMIAHGDTPYIVDYETFLTPQLAEGDAPHWAVLTAILPRWRKISQRKKWVDKSAFSGFYNERHKTNKHIPKFKNKRVNPYRYTTDFLQGFTKICDLFCQYKDVLLCEKKSPLLVFKNVITRIVLKDTAFYYRCLKTQCFEGVSAYEKAALENQDIPVFRVKSNSTSVFSANYQCPSLNIIQSGYSRMLNGIQKYANQEYVALQKSIIKQCLTAGFLNYKFRGKLRLGEKINTENRIATLRFINDCWVLARAN